MEYMDVHEAARIWELSERRVTALCRNGRISGAHKNGKLWLIPKETQKPIDARSRKALETISAPAMLKSATSHKKWS